MTRARPLLVLHYSELWLKGCNKPFFVSKLKASIEQTLEGLPVKLEGHVNERMVVSAQTPEAAQEAAERLQRVPGIEFIGVGVGIPPTLEGILATELTPSMLDRVWDATWAMLSPVMVPWQR